MALNFQTIANFFNTSSLGALAANFTKIAQEFPKVIYRDGSTTMSGELDMNGRRVINSGYPKNDNDLATLASIRPIAASIAKGDPGPADNTYTSYAAMQASDPTRKSARLVGDTDVPPHPDGPYNNPLSIVGGWEPQGSDGIVTSLPSSAAVMRFTRDKLGDSVAVQDFGAYGNGVNSDQVAIGNSVDYLMDKYGAGEINFPPAGVYKVSGLTDLPSRLRIKGPGSHIGALINGTHGGPIFRAISGVPGDIREYTTIQGMAFSGEGCTAVQQDASVSYLSRLMVSDCHFYGQLGWGIDANLIFGIISHNTFGYYGTTGASSGHIRSRGTGTNVSNGNTLMFNRFYKAKGQASVEWENGSDLDITRNNFEQNDSLPLLLRGVPSTNITRNFFEGNKNTSDEIVVAAGSALVNSSPLTIEGNTFVPFDSIARLIRFDVTMSDWSMKANKSTSLAGKQVSNSLVGLTESTRNEFPGVIFPNRITQERGNWSITDASGTGLNIQGIGEWSRNGDEISAEIGFAFPVNSNNGNAKIGGLPYPSRNVSFGSVGSNYGASGIDVATDGGSNTATFFSPGTLTPLTNAQLSGKIIYLRLSYMAS